MHLTDNQSFILHACIHICIHTVRTCTYVFVCVYLCEKYCFVAPNVAAISFTQLTYSFKEDSNIAQPVLLLSNPLTTDITIEVVDREGTATGEFKLEAT